MNRLTEYEYIQETGERIIWCNASHEKVIELLAAYEDAEEQGRLVILPCKVGDKVRDKIADYIFTIQTIELGHKAGTLFRCGNPGTDDYTAFYDFEVGERFDILNREEEANEQGIQAATKMLDETDKVAEWQYKTMSVPGGKGQTYAKWSCTHCKTKQKDRTKFCPECGYRMKNGEGT